MASEVSSSQPQNTGAGHHQPQPQQQAPSSQPQPSQALQQQQQQPSSLQVHPTQGGGLSSTNQGQSHGTRQYVATTRPNNRGNRGYNHNNNGNTRVYNNERNPQQGYGVGGVKMHFNNNMGSGGSAHGGSGHQNPNRYPIMRHFSNVGANVTLTPNPSFQLVPAISNNHFPPNQFPGISNQTSFEEPGHGLLQSPGQSFDPQQVQQQQSQQLLIPLRNQLVWSNGQVPTQNGPSVMEQPGHTEMNGAVFGENTIGSYAQSQQAMQQQQSQQMQQQQQPPPPPQQFQPAQTTYFPYNAQFGGGQTGAINPGMFFPHLSQYYSNPSAQTFIPGFGPFHPQFVNPSGYNPYGANSSAAGVVTGNGHGSGPIICSMCKQQLQAQEIQAPPEMVVNNENKVPIEPVQE